MRDRSDRLAAAAFVLSLVVLSVLYGAFATRWGWFPSPQITIAEQTIQDLSSHWKNDLELEPTRHLVEARTTGRGDDYQDFRVHVPGGAAPGFVLVAGLSPEPDVSFHAVTLYDDRGRQVHRWPVDYSRLDPDGLKPRNVMLHGMEVFPDGSLAVTFDAGNVLARIDACGQPVWTVDGPFHHSITADGEGGLWGWREHDDIVRIDVATGEIGRTLGFESQIMTVDGMEGVYAMRSYAADIDGVNYDADPFHTNDVEPLRRDMAAAFPMFEAGDLLISLRESNLVAVIEPTEGRLRWWQHGPWHKQHDPDFQPDGTITVYDNRTGMAPSRIMRIDPATGEMSTLLEGSAEAPFYSWQRGKHQVLPNGNILVTESEHGRVFEAHPDGGLIWERELVWDADRNLIVTEARHVPPDFFTDGPPSCDGLTTAAAETGTAEQ